MRLIEFIFLAGQLYSCGALFLRKEAPRSCTTFEGEIGECVLHDQCDSNSTIIEDGTGIINPRSLQSSACPLSTVCCKIPGKHQKHSDYSGEIHRNQPINSGERHRNQPILSRPETTNHPQTPYSVAFDRKEPKWSCTTMDGSPGECVQNYLCDTKTNSVITNGDGIIDVRIDESTDCPLPTVCCKIPDNRHKDSDPQMPNSDENYQNQPKTSDQETTNHPQTLSCTMMDGSPGECVQYYLCDTKTNSVITNGDGIIDVRINESPDCPLPTVCCKIPDHRQNNSDPQTPNSDVNYQNQPKTSDQETTNHPQTLSCTTMDGSPGECVQNYLCDTKTNSVITNGDDIIDVRINESPDCPLPTVCCKIPDHRQNNSDPQTSNSDVNYQNQPKTSDQETTNHPQTLSCTTMDGSPGECVQNYLCDTKTNSVITNGDDIIDVRINESPDCPLPTICCKIPDHRQNNSDPQTPNSDVNYQNQPKTSDQETTNHPQTLSCTTMDGSPGECVQNYLCDTKTNSVITNGDDIIDVRINESTDCPLPTICCKIPDNRQKDSDPQTPNSEVNYQNQPKTSDQETTNHSQTLSCTTMDGSPGECVQNYLCDIDTNSVITNGDRIIDVRINESTDCPLPRVCCKIPNNNQEDPAHSKELDRNQQKTIDQETINHPQTLNQETMNHPQKWDQKTLNHPQMWDQETMNHSQTLDQETINHSQTLDQETMNHLQMWDQKTMNHPQMWDQKTMNHPQKWDQKTLNHPQMWDQKTMNHPQMWDQRTLNHPQSMNQETMNHPQSLSCTTTDGKPGECVKNYLCDIETSTRVKEKNSANTNGCPMPMICCKVPDISSRSNLPPQSALYPYIRVPRDMNRSGCGLRNPDGVNVTGATFDTAPEYAKPGEFPWTVAVVNLKGRIDKMAQFFYLGSGALIHERAVLTAAHIFRGASTQTTFYVVIGDHNQRAVNILPRKAIGVQNVEIHNLYDKNLFYDIALVFLQKPVLVSGHVNYICLPPPDYQDPVGTRCISSGWGKNGFNEHQYIMNKAELPVVEHTACQSLLRRVDELGPLFELHSSFMCAGEGGVDSCKGSGGAPLACPMQNEPDRYVLSGVVSWSNNCSLDGIPSVYARVPTVRQWIDDKMAANGYPITSK